MYTVAVETYWGGPEGPQPEYEFLPVVLPSRRSARRYAAIVQSRLEPGERAVVLEA